MKPVVRNLTNFPDGLAVEFTTREDQKVNGLSLSKTVFIPLDAYEDEIKDFLSSVEALLNQAMGDFEVVGIAPILGEEDDDE